MVDVILTPLKQICHPQGDIFHALKKTDVGFFDFGEAYFSTINKGEIKGWKKHHDMILNLVVPVGAIKFAIYENDFSDYYEVTLSRFNYQRLTVASNLWVAFKGIDENNMLLNIANIVHDPLESTNCELESVKHEW